MPFLSALDRNTYFSHKFFRIVGNAVVNERDFTRKANNLHLLLINILQKLLVLWLCLCMTSSEAQSHAAGFRHFHRFASENILLIQNQKNAIILFCLCLFQVLRRNTKSDLSEKNHGLCVRLIQLTDRCFHICIAPDFQRIIHPHKAASRNCDQRDGVERRILSIC